jgi:methyl-accepting chemotaxis protein
MEQIKTASEEQSLGIGETNEAVANMDRVTQENASMVQKNSAEAESLTDLADKLSELIGFFKVANAGRVV